MYSHLINRLARMHAMIVTLMQVACSHCVCIMHACTVNQLIVVNSAVIIWPAQDILAGPHLPVPLIVAPTAACTPVRVIYYD